MIKTKMIKKKKETTSSKKRKSRSVIRSKDNFMEKTQLNRYEESKIFTENRETFQTSPSFQDSNSLNSISAPLPTFSTVIAQGF